MCSLNGRSREHPSHLIVILSLEMVRNMGTKMRLFGIETEYGITREDQDVVDPVVESMELVRAHLTASFERRWDYGGEDPHEDARGVSGLRPAAG